MCFVVGGCFVEGNWLSNAFRWKETTGPWEERPGHYGDVWNYWTDDGLGYYEFLQVNVCWCNLILHPLISAWFVIYSYVYCELFTKLAEDLDALPIWVFNAGRHYLWFTKIPPSIISLIINAVPIKMVVFCWIVGISHNDAVNSSMILPFVKVPFVHLDLLFRNVQMHYFTYYSIYRMQWIVLSLQGGMQNRHGALLESQWVILTHFRWSTWQLEMRIVDTDHTEVNLHW